MTTPDGYHYANFPCMTRSDSRILQVFDLMQQDMLNAYFQNIDGTELKVIDVPDGIKYTLESTSYGEQIKEVGRVWKF